jgi:hypothetical protein
VFAGTNYSEQSKRWSLTHVKNTKYFQIKYEGNHVNPILITPCQTSLNQIDYLYASLNTNLGTNSHFTVIQDCIDDNFLRFESRQTHE